ncbi:MAG: hypothetical protein WBC06_14400 [Chitinophagaceae bacterium]
MFGFNPQVDVTINSSLTAVPLVIEPVFEPGVPLYVLPVSGMLKVPVDVVV